MTDITSLGHIALKVRDLDAMAHFYRDQVEGSAGITHICLTVADLDVEAARLSANGMALTSQIKTGLGGNRGAWIEDPEGCNSGRSRRSKQGSTRTARWRKRRGSSRVLHRPRGSR